MHARWMGAAAALVVLVASAAAADTLKFAATLRGADETPPNTSAGTGQVTATLDTSTKSFSYHVTYSGLTGPATMAHFHLGAPGVAGPPVVPVPAAALSNPMTGSATLTDAQAADLEAGKWYFNIHTAAHPGGEVRGQVTQTH